MAARRVTVFGSSRVSPADPEYHEAVRLGRLLAEAGYVVYTGGYAGTMEAVCRGVAESGGVAIGVTMQPWAKRARANAWVTQEVVAPDLFARLRLLIASDAYIALSGGSGTLGEVALAWNLFQTESIAPCPLVLVGPRWRTLVHCFRSELRLEARDLDLLAVADTVDDVLPYLAGIARSGAPLGGAVSHPSSARSKRDHS
jgi:uncharacterized protein (TIGR00730 family)